MSEASAKKTILVSLAHPDDESFGMGGTLAHYASLGAEVYLICATNGDVGTVSPEYLEGFDSIAERRRYELQCAAQILGLKEVFFLNYRDSGMQGSADNRHPDSLVSAPLDEVAEKVTSYIRRLQPQVVLTFDPVGGYYHPDHIAIHNATVKAFHAAGDPEQFPQAGDAFHPRALYYHLISRRMLRFAVRVLRLLGRDPTRFGRNKDIDLVMLAGDEDYPVHVRVDHSSVAELREKAAACHASQLDLGESVVTRVFAFLARFAAGKDSFMRAYPEAPADFLATDLFSYL